MKGLEVSKVVSTQLLKKSSSWITAKGLAKLSETMRNAKKDRS